MRVLFVHNNYGTVSGEELMVEKIISILRRNDHLVQTFFEDSTKINSNFDKTKALFSGVYSLSARKKIHQLVMDFKPDIAQIQNLYPLISPSILPELRYLGVPVVMRVANYRLVCPNGLFLSHGVVCERCSGGREYHCLLRNCENNFFKSFGYALRNFTARKLRLYSENVRLFYTQTEFQKRILVREGFHEDRVKVIPNMVDMSYTHKFPVEMQDQEYVAYAGRISHEKGISTLVEAAYKCRKIDFRIAGDDQYSQEIKKRSSENLRYVGHLKFRELMEFFANCRIVVMPSICYEGFPSVIIEAMLNGKPVIASRIGGIPEIVEDGVTGLLFDPGNPDDLLEKIQYLYNNPALCLSMGKEGHKKVLREYTGKTYYSQLISLYKEALLNY